MDNGSAQGNKLYVGGIPYRSTEDDIKKAFGEAGSVASASIISDRMTGRSRGFGFVEMENDGEAQQAIDALNGLQHENRPLTVNEAKPREDRGGGRPRGEGGPAGGGGFGGSDRGRRY